MLRENVLSSNVAFFSFNEELNSLVIGYLTRYSEKIRIYRYQDIPASVVNQLRKAASKGEFICSDIAFKYSYEFIGSETDSD